MLTLNVYTHLRNPDKLPVLNGTQMVSVPKPDVYGFLSLNPLALPWWLLSFILACSLKIQAARCLWVRVCLIEPQ
jgi:hypothetical protein